MGLFQELKRRNVFKVAIAYIIVAWLLLQISDTLVPALYLPGWFHSGVAFVLILGFPVAIIFAWAFELTPEGLKREREVDRTESISHHTGRKLDFFIIGLLVVALGYFIWESRFQPAQVLPDKLVATGTDEPVDAGAPIAVPPGKSIAVLPFVNMSNDPDQEYFSDGIAEELLNVLAKYPGLRVAARTSSFQFKGQNPDIADIAEKLHVSHVLEGSVRKAGTRLRITAQLIETNTGFHLWSETYDRELDDVFAIQDEISAAIGAALKVQLALGGGAGTTSPTVRAAANTAAFDAYIQARQLINLRGRNNLEAAVTHLERALALDEAYAPAHAQLAIAINLLSDGPSSYGSFTLEEVERRATPHIERAFELDQQLPEVFGARTLLRLNTYDFDNAIMDARQALQLNPSYVDVINWLFIAYAGLGRDLEANETLERLMEVDPLSIVGRTNYAPRLALLGQMNRARALADSIYGQNPVASYITHGFISIETQGKLAEALEWYLKAYALDPENSFNGRGISWILGQLSLLPEALRLPEDWRHWAYRGMAMWPELIADLRQRLELDPSSSANKIFLADALHLSGNIAQAQLLYEDLLAKHPDRAIRNTALVTVAPTARAAVGRMRSGDEAGAIALVELTNEVLRNRSRAGLRDGDYHRTAAILKALEGNTGLAINDIDEAIEAGHRDRSIFSEPAFDAFRDAPEFQALVSKLNTINTADREKALQMMCFNNPIPDAWQPLPGTCDGVKAVP